MSCKSERSLLRSYVIRATVACYRQVIPNGIASRLPARIINAKTIQRAPCPHIDSSVGDRRRREAFIIELIHRQDLPVTFSLQNRHRSGLADQKHFAVGADR